MATAELRAVGLLKAQRGQDLNLLAGQLYFGDQATVVRTLLGSCVGITLWHPRRRVGGMCHFLLPQRSRDSGTTRDGRFGDEALEILVESLLRIGTRPAEYDAHLYGGADAIPDAAKVKLNIGERNIEKGWALIEHYGFQLRNVDVGDRVPRTVQLSLADGAVLKRRGASIGRA